jgi:hypothetical protein
MPANTSPIFGRTPDVQLAGAVIGSSANTATDGTGANTYLIFTADATEGSFVQKAIFKPISSVAATVIRLWFCSDTGAFSAGTTNTAANTTMIAEMSTIAWTASNTLAALPYEIPINIAMPPGTKLLVTFGTSTGASTTGFNPLVIGMKF